MALEQIISGLSYMGIFILMFSNGIFSFPSSQVLYIIVGYFVGVGTLALPTALVVGAIGNTIGNIALYEFAREHGMNAALKFLPMKPHHVAKTERFFEKKGLGFLFIAKLLPTLKVFVPIFGGIGKAPRIPCSSPQWSGLLSSSKSACSSGRILIYGSLTQARLQLSLFLSSSSSGEVIRTLRKNNFSHPN
jgi:membrane protein DedA with SNARE-associated domain